VIYADLGSDHGEAATPELDGQVAEDQEEGE